MHNSSSFLVSKVYFKRQSASPRRGSRTGVLSHDSSAPCVLVSFKAREKVAGSGQGDLVEMCRGQSRADYTS